MFYYFTEQKEKKLDQTIIYNLFKYRT